LDQERPTAASRTETVWPRQAGAQALERRGGGDQVREEREPQDREGQGGVEAADKGALANLARVTRQYRFDELAALERPALESVRQRITPGDHLGDSLPAPLEGLFVQHPIPVAQERLTV